jgi:glutaconate CoA-transferase subunit B
MNVQNTASTYTPTEIMTVTAARALRPDDVCFVGIGAPSAACNLARLTHAPGITLIYESGTIDTKPEVLPLSIGDGELCDTALTTVSVPEMFRYWLQGGRISVGFLGGAQIDRFANLNTTVVGDYHKPKVRLPGGGGAPEIATKVITDLCVFEPDPQTKELTVVSLHPGVSREDIQKQCGWPVRFVPEVGTTDAPSAQELQVLRELQERTKRAHGGDA